VVSEITNSLEVEVSAPKPCAEAIKEGRSPTIFLIYNLSDDQMKFLLQRGVWSSQTITFHALPFSPPCPNFLFSIRGFTTHAVETIIPIIQQVWDDNETRDFISLLTQATPEEMRGEIETAICLFLDSMWIQRLDTKRAGETLIPRFNVYADSSGISLDEVWVRLRQFLTARTYHSTMQGRGIFEASPYHCGVCHGVDHPRGLCPLPDTPGWNGPPKRPFMDGARRRNNRLPGPGQRALSHRFIM
jgi:hypothetical protein